VLHKTPCNRVFKKALQQKLFISKKWFCKLILFVITLTTERIPCRRWSYCLAVELYYL